MDAATLASRLDYAWALLRRLPSNQPARLVGNDDDGIMLLIDSADALQTMRAMFPPGTVIRQTRPGTLRATLDGIVVMVQEPLPEPAPVAQEIKL